MNLMLKSVKIPFTWIWNDMGLSEDRKPPHFIYLTTIFPYLPYENIAIWGESLRKSGRSTDQFSHPATQHLRRKRSKWIAGLGATCSLTGHDVHPSRVYVQRSPPGGSPGRFRATVGQR